MTHGSGALREMGRARPKALQLSMIFDGRNNDRISYMDKPRQKSSISKKRIVLAIVLFLFFAIFIPLAMPDGTEQYTGVKKDAARAGLDYLNSKYRGINGIDTIGTIKMHVDSVVLSDSKTVCNSPFSTTDESGLVDDYSIYISFKTIFGLPLGSSVPTHVCRYPPSHR